MSAQVATIPRRADFLRAARARRHGTPAFLVQARYRAPDSGASAASPSMEAASDAIRVGLTCSKKVGNAVVRNRARRRLRALANEVLPQHGRPGWDYVLVGRHGATVSHDFAAMRNDLLRALARLHPPA
ncbi:ribonuclease P protein component [Rhodobaculum claviforme]|uniref:Ribonuclease P protein component n=1 Tax=Rhodobaculum claviforme TaxID=1549854 RepID=A0A934TNI8_9RHOB|nr:ribonuclease P protein component [Rhodobaculum claviforme]MBK5928856.1 ribonuclease P protein component [Rhodobaculum claviforme]